MDTVKKKPLTHLVLAFGFSKKLLHGIHGLLEALTLVNLYHFFFVQVIRLQLFHLDPSTWKKKIKKSVIFSNSSFLNHPTPRNSDTFLVQSNQRQAFHSMKDCNACIHWELFSGTFTWFLPHITHHILLALLPSKHYWHSISRPALRCDQGYLFRTKADQWPLLYHQEEHPQSHATIFGSINPFIVLLKVINPLLKHTVL